MAARESGAPYELVVHDLSKGTHKAPEYLAVNPDGKVPALVDRGAGARDGSPGWPVTVTESSAICAYVAEAVPSAGLAGHRRAQRAAYLTWLFYAPAASEPSLTDAMSPRVNAPAPGTIGWPPFDAVVARVRLALTERTPWLLGAQFTAADLMIGGMLDWLDQWGKVAADDAPLQRYLTALRQRPALGRARAREAEIVAAMG
ncbi:MAG: glutathione S-transferase family protein [Myxococcota bacterium]